MSIDNIPDLSVSAKRELLRSLALKKGQGTDGLIPLSLGQRALWFVYRLAPSSPAYNFLYAAKLSSQVDVDALRRAFRGLADRHPLLRSIFEGRGRKPVQRVLERSSPPVEVVDASSKGLEDLVGSIRQDAARPFDLLAAPALRAVLYERAPGESVLALVVHHIIADLWSMDVLLRELGALYAAELSGSKGSLPSPASYADFVRWQTLWIAGPEGKRAWEYWDDELSGDLPVLDLPTDRPRPPVQTYRGDAHTWALDESLVDRIRDLAGREKTTPFTVLLTVFQAFLHRYTGQEDILVGTATAGRGRPEWESIVGYCLNQLALRAEVSGESTFTDLLRRSRLKVLRALEHQDFPFSLLVERLQPARQPGRPPVFQVMFIWDKPLHLTAGGSTEVARNGRPDSPALFLEPVLMEQCGAPFDLTLIILETGSTLRASLRYNADLFEPETIARMAAHLDTLLREVGEDPGRRIADLEILTAEERRNLRPDAEGGARSILEVPFPDLFQEQAASTPEATAIVCDGRSLSYRDLDDRSNALARLLRRRGVRPGKLAGICVPRSIDMVVAVLATWKAGGAYVPLDPAYPERRLLEMLEESRPTVLLSVSASLDRLPSQRPPVICLDDDWTLELGPEPDEPLPSVGPEDLAYIIFTSGSTGRPKGVLLRHRGLSNLSEAQREVFDLGPEDRSALFASLSFDASVFEMVMPLRVGAALVVATQSSILPGPDLARLLRDERVTTITIPPSVLALLPLEDLPDLRTIIVAGEACPAEVVADWAPGRRFFNAYGPTEATVWSTVARCVPDGQAPPIGDPIVNTRLYVLDPNLKAVPIGVPGELHIAGPGIALGYLNQPGLTVEKFLPNPFDPAHDGVLYKTGDLVRYRGDGTLEFLGRLDHQVKIRGYRIEPGEIQEVLREHPAVRDAVVIARRGPTGGSDALIAYVVPRTPGTDPTTELRGFLRGRLTHYMLPSAIVCLPALPLTRNGKIDREALPSVDARPSGVATMPSAARNAVERQLVAIWSDVLKVDSLGILDNFFDLGGASLQTLEVVKEARKVGIALSPEMIFQYQSIAELAERCGVVDPHTPESSPSAPSLTLPLTGGSPTARPEIAAAKTVIESFGVYLPPRVVTTDEVIRGCAQPLSFPLERMTGIKSRRMAGETEFAIDLAASAVADCLSRSVYGPSDIDLLICCNISRCDGPDHEFSYEPTTAAGLQHRFGLGRALAFDLSNACAGTFTAITVADAYLRAGTVRRALIVSGEHISHLTRTAQLEIADFVDPRIACLTLGDSGVAIVLERRDGDSGFQDLDLQTFGKYSNLCVAKATDRPHGGAIMITDAVKSSALTINQAVGHALRTLERRGWRAEEVAQIIMHQTSETTLEGAVREINRALGKTVCHRGNTVYNLAERGNTATNSHFVALMDNIRSGAVKSGDRVLFGVSGSGQTIGTALYTFDELPDRILHPEAKTERRGDWPALPANEPVRVRVSAIGTLPGSLGERPTRGNLESIRAAGQSCLESAGVRREDVGLVIHSGVYRDEFLSEPAVAAIAAGLLEINHDAETPGNGRTLAFDLMNGGTGTLNACHVAATLIRAGRSTNALVLASEVENNPVESPLGRLGIEETASALFLERSTDREGFRAFAFRAFPEHVESFRSHTDWGGTGPALRHTAVPGFESLLVDAIRIAVGEFLDAEGLALDAFRRIFPPARPGPFVDRLAEALGLPLARFVVLPGLERDHFTSALAYTFRHAREQHLVARGDLGLIISCGAGIQVGCASYEF